MPPWATASWVHDRQAVEGEPAGHEGQACYEGRAGVDTAEQLLPDPGGDGHHDRPDQVGEAGTDRAVAEDLLHGLDAPLEEIAQRAGVSIGTLYNRFGSREALLDDVVADIATEKLESAVAKAAEGTTAWKRFRRYVEEVCALQAPRPGLLRRGLEALPRSTATARRLPLHPGLRQRAEHIARRRSVTDSEFTRMTETGRTGWLRTVRCFGQDARGASPVGDRPTGGLPAPVPSAREATRLASATAMSAMA
jgi:AcrR family transcriptional regulator